MALSVEVVPIMYKGHSMNWSYGSGTNISVYFDMKINNGVVDRVTISGQNLQEVVDEAKRIIDESAGV